MSYRLDSSPKQSPEDSEVAPASNKPAHHSSAISKGLRGLGPAFGATLIERVLQLAKIVALTRLLGPHDFGVFGIALLVLSLSDQITQPGIEAGLVQGDTVDRRVVHTGWWVLAARGLALATLGFLSAPIIGAFFHTPAVVPILRVTAAVQLLNGLVSVELFIRRRNLNFWPQFFVRGGAAGIDLVVAVSLALLGAGVWALAIGVVVAGVVKVVLSYVVAPYRPRLVYDRLRARSLFRFSRWAGLLNFTLALLTQGDAAVVGHLLNVTALSFYQVGYRLANLPTTEVTHIVSIVTLPAYSQIRREGGPLDKTFTHSLRLTATLSLFLGMGAVALAHPLVLFMLGPRWIAVVPVLQILSVWGMTRSMDATSGALFFSVGRPDLDAKLHLAKLAILAVGVYPLTTRFGVSGAAIAVVVAGLCVSPVTLFLAARHSGAQLRDLAMALPVPLAVGMAAWAASALLQSQLDHVAPIVTLVLCTVVYAGIYSALVFQRARTELSRLTTLRSGPIAVGS